MSKKASNSCFRHLNPKLLDVVVEEHGLVNREIFNEPDRFIEAHRMIEHAKNRVALPIAGFAIQLEFWHSGGLSFGSRLAVLLQIQRFLAGA